MYVGWRLDKSSRVLGSIHSMSHFNPYQSGTSLIVALAMTASVAAPIVMPRPASAGLFPSQGTSQRTYERTQAVIPYGTSIRVYYDKADKIVVAPKETVPLTLRVADNIRSRSGALLIPADSQIVGELQPTYGGSQFVARELLLYGGRRQPLDATSEVLSQTQEVNRGTNVGAILTGAAVGAGAAAAISAVTGNHHIGLGSILGGAGAGALGGLLLGGQKKTNVIVINPNTDLNLTLRSSLALR
ncbi:MAG: hypothetical protein NVS2B14_18730 [Chamaesiphon sp.]